MGAFKVATPKTLAEALELLRDSGQKAAPYGGSTDLLGVLKDRLLVDPPTLLVNLKKIEALSSIVEVSGGLSIGAMETLSAIVENPKVKEMFPLLADAAKAVGSPQLRNMGTIGGNVCQEVRCWYYRYPNHLGAAVHCMRKGGKGCPAVNGDNRIHSVIGAKGCFAAAPSDTAVALSVLDGCYFAASPTGLREIPLDDFHTPLGLSLNPGELLTGLKILSPTRGARQFFTKFTLRKPIDFALVSLAGVVEEEGGVYGTVRLSLGGVAPFPYRLSEVEAFLKGKVRNQETAEAAAALVLKEARPLSRNGYKVDIARALVSEGLCPAPVESAGYAPPPPLPGDLGTRFHWSPVAECQEDNCPGARSKDHNI